MDPTFAVYLFDKRSMRSRNSSRTTTPMASRAASTCQNSLAAPTGTPPTSLESTPRQSMDLEKPTQITTAPATKKQQKRQQRKGEMENHPTAIFVNQLYNLTDRVTGRSRRS